MGLGIVRGLILDLMLNNLAIGLSLGIVIGVITEWWEDVTRYNFGRSVIKAKV